MTEHERLLKDVLKGEWGFDGVVTSDWHAARSTTATALATLDLAMPGPDGPWGEQLASAVCDGVGTEQILDDKLLCLLALARRVGALVPVDSDRPAEAKPQGVASLTMQVPPEQVRLVDPGLLLKVTASSFVLLRH